MIVTTETGSVYHIGLLSKTWTRLSATEDSGPLRSRGGEFEEIEPIEIGKPVTMFCPPINPPYRRMIQTSLVTKIEEDR
jgi:hypothetical protein